MGNDTWKIMKKAIRYSLNKNALEFLNKNDNLCLSIMVNRIFNNFLITSMVKR